ncbi:hypothetical protein C1H46_034871 [Malus baccata]|uniref:KANL3/Tex30 alpha/beta hydrolase-like domain-containing protein n=1 Tax=Malus baccata TaxID=106549 RepID=A0A540KZC2_MALBA|nr:hypothetical protein C1H46_034871 [Malus baccata]
MRWRNYQAYSSKEKLIKDPNPFHQDISDGKKRAPPKAEKLVDFHGDVAKKAVAKYPGHPLIFAGKPMGSRVSCMVACKEDIHASAINCLGYPLRVRCSDVVPASYFVLSGMNGVVRDE